MNSINRRQFLMGATAIVTGLCLPLKSALAKSVTLEAGVARHKFLPDKDPAKVWAYNASVPGTMLRYKRGETARIQFRNNLPDPTSVHWHGVRIDNKMDGVADMTQDAIPAQGEFFYEFDLPDAGTYWYHSHNRSWDQLARGLYGPLIIEEDTPYPVDQDVTWLLDDWRLNQDGALDLQSMGNGHDWSHGGRLGNFGTVNGESSPSFNFPKNSRIRVRLINVANARVLYLKMTGAKTHLIALDGQPLPSTEELSSEDIITLAPAQRADLVIDVSGAGSLDVLGRERSFPIAKFEAIDGATQGLTHSPVPALPSNNLPEPDLTQAKNYDLLMQGGAMRWLEKGTYHGKEMTGRELAAENQFWTFNGTAGHTHSPLFDVSQGTHVAINIVNQTMWPHGIHLHGHHFREILNDGAELGPWRDTILLEREETKRIVFVADNPGKWMLHCHMLEHHAAGMGTWFKVT